MKTYFSTHMIEAGKAHLGLDRFFLNFSLYQDDGSRLNDLLQKEYLRLEGFMRRRNGLSTAHAKSSERQSRTHDTTVAHIRRYHAMCKIEQACRLIDAELQNQDYLRCVIFGASKAILECIRIHLAPYRPMCVYPGSDPKAVAIYQKNFSGLKRRVIAVHVNATHKMALDCSNHAFFIEESLDIDTNISALNQVMGGQPELYVRNFCLTDPLDIKVSEAIRIGMSKKLKGESLDLPEEFI